jgi:FtsH-binding integral membrane protein
MTNMNALSRNENLYYPVESIIDLQSVMRQVYAWMVLGMLLTAFVAYFTVSTSVSNLAANPTVLLAAVIAELGAVLAISLGFNRLSSGTATALFFVYAALNGFTLSIVLLAFSVETVFLAFASTAALFGAMSVIGYTTKVDLSRMGTYLMMALIGLMIALVINLIVNSGPLDVLVSIVGVLIFTGLTAYDTQSIGRMAAQVSSEGDAGVKFGIFGALKLYLDFINMFLLILRLFGGRRR